VEPDRDPAPPVPRNPCAAEWDCDVDRHEAEAGIAFSLRYSGTPITEPGTYKIQSWGRKTYYHSAGAYEYDGGIGLMGDDE
jgi:hypothetical protein